MSQQERKIEVDSVDRVIGLQARKDYDPPRLTVYGDLRELTAGGVRNHMENSNTGSTSTHA